MPKSVAAPSRPKPPALGSHATALTDHANDTMNDTELGPSYTVRRQQCSGATPNDAEPRPANVRTVKHNYVLVVTMLHCRRTPSLLKLCSNASCAPCAKCRAPPLLSCDHPVAVVATH